jgi:hypothetical protein
MASKIRYTRTHNGEIGRTVDGGATEWVVYIRFCGDRAESIQWGTAADAAHGWDDRAWRAVRNFNRLNR